MDFKITHRAHIRPNLKFFLRRELNSNFIVFLRFLFSFVFSLLTTYLVGWCNNITKETACQGKNQKNSGVQTVNPEFGSIKIKVGGGNA